MPDDDWTSSQKGVLMKTRKGAAAQDKRREEARARQLQRDELTPEEQIARLDARLGAGKGAKKERERLAALIDLRDNPKG